MERFSLALDVNTPLSQHSSLCIAVAHVLVASHARYMT